MGSSSSSSGSGSGSSGSGSGSSGSGSGSSGSKGSGGSGSGNGSSDSVGNKPVNGGEWTGKMFFDPEASTTLGESYLFQDHELLGKLLKIIDPEEKILKVFAFNNPLIPIQLTKRLWKHTFIVLETDAWWWSLEKHTDGITLQRDKSLQAVQCRYRQQQRTTGLRGITLDKEDEAQGTMEDLVRWLWKTNVLNDKYNLLNSNCLNFAKAVFNRVAVNKTLS